MGENLRASPSYRCVSWIATGVMRITSPGKYAAHGPHRCGVVPWIRMRGMRGTEQHDERRAHERQRSRELQDRELAPDGVFTFPYPGHPGWRRATTLPECPAIRPACAATCRRVRASNQWTFATPNAQRRHFVRRRSIQAPVWEDVRRRLQPGDSVKREVIRVEPLSTWLERSKAPTLVVTRHGDTVYVCDLRPFDPATGEVANAPLEPF